MEAAQMIEHPTFETVWAGLQELRQILKENTDEQKERHKEIDRIIKENAEAQKETERQMKKSSSRLNKQLGRLGNRFGEMVEHMVKPNLEEKFREMGFVFTKTHSHTVIRDEQNNFIAEMDISLENGDKVMVVEVKSKLTTDDVADHVERMEKIRAYADLHHDKRKYLGAIAGMVMSGSEKIFALKNGFYVIEPSGEAFTITAPEGVYSVREW
ncbi:MAG: PD-(D/E)XK nuclease family protein [Treponema sp.]|jgi:hypothetical protein|nr:PD-(D/E)XK nuclease family protein [Treponema sp.]